jgi:Xaa-Pro aminopeptidase
VSTRSPEQIEPLLYATPEDNADIFYYGGVLAPDPLLAFGCGGRRVAVPNQLEFARVRREGRFDEVLALEDWVRQADAAALPPPRQTAAVIACLAQAHGISGFRVPADFPAGLAMRLRELGLLAEVVEGPFFPERMRKSDAEADAIRAGNAASAAGFRVVERFLRAAEIRGGWLWHGGRRLTSERLRRAIEIALLERGARATQTIVAGGDQACDPHGRGSGPLRAGELIIVDIFPKVVATGYHGDMTRTYLKGRPSEAQRSLVETVLAVQQWAIGRHKAGVDGRLLYAQVCERFIKAGYTTRRDNGVPVGFFHGLGHGLGLDVHEPPRVNPSGGRLRAGVVLTVEPGLYYPGLGGCRFEDVVRVRRDGPEMLSSHPYRWQIR